MKSLLLVLAFSAASFVAAADVTLTDAGTVVKDGVSYNNIADALLNRQITSAEFAGAFLAFHQRLVSERQAALAAQAAAETKLAALVAGARQALDKATSEQRIAAAVKLLEQAEQSQAEKELRELEVKAAELAKRKAEIEAKLRED